MVLSFNTPIACQYGHCTQPLNLHRRSLSVYCTGPSSEDALPAKLPSNSLGATIRRKRDQVAVQLNEIGPEIAERLEGGAQVPASPAHRLAQLIEDIPLKIGRPVLVCEVQRPSPASTSSELAEIARDFVACGADALAVGTDAEDSSNGVADLFAVCRAVKVPVLMRDWVIHMLQVLEAKEAGAAGVLGTVFSVTGAGSALISSYSAAIGIDSPIEVVNSSEVEQLNKLGVPMYGINLAVGISLALPGFNTDIAKGLLDSLPAGAVSVVGAKTLEEAIKAREAGADVLLIKKEWLADVLKEERPVQQEVSREGSSVEASADSEASTSREERGEKDPNTMGRIHASRQPKASEQLRPAEEDHVEFAQGPSQQRCSGLSGRQKRALASLIRDLQYATSGDG